MNEGPPGFQRAVRRSPADRHALGELEDQTSGWLGGLKTSPDACRAVDEIRVLADYIRGLPATMRRFAPSATLRAGRSNHDSTSSPRPRESRIGGRTGLSRRRPGSFSPWLPSPCWSSRWPFRRCPCSGGCAQPRWRRARRPIRAGREQAIADADGAAKSPAPAPVETLAEKPRRSEKTPGCNRRLPGSKHRPRRAAESPMESAGAYAHGLQKGDAPSTEAARMLKAPLAGQPADAAAEESASATARGREAAPAEPRRALSQLQREASAAAAGESQDRLDAVSERKPQAKREAAGPAAVSLGLNDLKRAPEQVNIIAEPQSAGTSRPMLRGAGAAGPRKALSASIHRRRRPAGEPRPSGRRGSPWPTRRLLEGCWPRRARRRPRAR